MENPSIENIVKDLDTGLIGEIVRNFRSDNFNDLTGNEDLKIGQQLTLLNKLGELKKVN